MNNAMKRSILPLVIFLALSWYLFFFRLDAMGLTDPDETFYAQTAKEMLSRNEWMTPHIFGKPQFEKPIFFYWLVELSFKVFGVNETAARLPSAVFGMIGIAATYFLGRLLFNKRTGLIAAVMLATSVEYVILSRACVTDMTLFSLMLLGVLFFFYGHIRDKRYSYFLSAAFFALAVLTKGPIAAMLPGLAFVLYFAFTRDWKSLSKIPFLAMAAVFIAVAAPWYLAMYRAHGNVFIDAFFGFQNIVRFTQSEHKIGSGVWYNIPILLGGFFPWSVFLPFGLWLAFKKVVIRDPLPSNYDSRKGLIFVLAWFFSIFLFFTISSTKLPTYIFPCFVAAALISAVSWDEFLKDRPSRPAEKWVAGACYALVVIIILGIAGGSLYLSGHYSPLLKSLTVPYSILLFGMLMSLVAILNGKKLWTFMLIAYAILLFLYPVSKLVLPELEKFETSKILAAKLTALMSPGDWLGSEDRYMEGLTFYTGHIPQDLDNCSNIANLFSSKDRVWCVLKDRGNIQFSAIGAYIAYRLGRMIIVTNKLPGDGKYPAGRGIIR